MKLKNTYFLLRHGQTPYQLNRERIIYPWPEPSPILLTEKGKKEIEKAARKLKKENIDLIFSSPLPRTRESAEIVAEELGIGKVIFDERLREIDLGSYKGGLKKKYIKEFLEKEGSFYKKPPGGGESWKDVKERVENFLKEVESRYRNKKILIVSHGNPLVFLEGVIKNKKDEDLFWGKIKFSFKTGELRKIN
jgi:broad specificity phosphatase PhoE